jgi:hypothetical protein
MEMYVVFILKGSRFSGCVRKLIDFPHISILMDIMVVDVLDSWGMLLSRRWSAGLGGFLAWTLPMHTFPWDMVPSRYYAIEKRIIDM